MAFYRITKYNPQFRRKDGSYGKSEWTSVSDIGRIYQDGQLTVESYLQVETAYVKAITQFLLQANCKKLTVNNLELKENYGALPKQIIAGSKEMLNLIQDGAEISGEIIEGAVRLNLREIIWCRLHGDNGVYIHFGYDYYMYIGIESNSFYLPLLPEGIFVETIESPYYGNIDSNDQHV